MAMSRKVTLPDGRVIDPSTVTNRHDALVVLEQLVDQLLLERDMLLAEIARRDSAAGGRKESS